MKKVNDTQFQKLINSNLVENYSTEQIIIELATIHLLKHPTTTTA